MKYKITRIQIGTAPRTRSFKCRETVDDLAPFRKKLRERYHTNTVHFNYMTIE